MSRAHAGQKPAIADGYTHLPTKRRFIITDSGLFVDLATTLARAGHEVMYFMPWVTAFSQRNQKKVAVGIPGVERIYDWEQFVDDEDLCWVFPDIGWPERQLMLQDMGRRVWGSRRGQQLELDRKKAKAAMAKAGLSVGEYVIIKGISDLRDYTKSHKDVWVKSSETRGDFESFFAENYRLIEPRIDEIEYRLGVDADNAEFIVEQNIPDALELAADVYTIDGAFPSRGTIGVECKGKGYLGHFLPASQWPKQLTDINEAVSPLLKRWMYRNFFAMEARVTKDGTPWVIDPACRFGSPPSELLQIMYANLPDIIWEGAGGKLIDPVPAARWGAQLIVYSSFAEDNWQPVDFPAKLRPNISLRYCSMQKGGYAVRPQPSKLSHVGSVQALGATAQEAIDACKEMAKQVHGHGIEVYPNALDTCLADFKKMHAYRM